MEEKIIQFQPPEPNLKQSDFLISARAENGYQVIGAGGGAGGGKTNVICQLITDLCITIPGAKVAVVRKIKADLDATTKQELFKVLDLSFVLHEDKEHDIHTIKTIHEDFTSEIHWLGLDKMSRWGSRFFTHIIIDEGMEVSEREFVLLLTRLRHKLPTQITGVPLKARNLKQTYEHGNKVWEGCATSHYIYWDAEEDCYQVHRFIAISFNPPEEYNSWLQQIFIDKCLNGKTFKSHFTQFTSYDNRQNLDKSYIEILEALPTDEFNRMVLGKWSIGHDGKPCTPHFNFEQHTFLEPPPPQDALEIFMGLDFGWVMPFAVWMTVEQKCAYIWAELRGKDIDLADYLIEIKKAEKWINPEALVIDWVDGTHGRQHTDKAKQTSLDICRAAKRNIRHKYSRPDWRAQAVNLLLRQNRLKIHRNCQLVIGALGGGWGRDKDTGDVLKDGFWEHIGDALGYVIWGEFENDVKAFISRRTRGVEKDTDAFLVKQHLVRSSSRNDGGRSNMRFAH